ncbi:MAG TPA: hypothetical protein VIR57_05080, partial [Chloroflexota bacterium]
MLSASWTDRSVARAVPWNGSTAASELPLEAEAGRRRRHDLGAGEEVAVEGRRRDGRQLVQHAALAIRAEDVGPILPEEDLEVGEVARRRPGVLPRRLGQLHARVQHTLPGPGGVGRLQARLLEERRVVEQHPDADGQREGVELAEPATGGEGTGVVVAQR